MALPAGAVGDDRSGFGTIVSVDGGTNAVAPQESFQENGVDSLRGQLFHHISGCSPDFRFAVAAVSGEEPVRRKPHPRQLLSP